VAILRKPYYDGIVSLAPPPPINVRTARRRGIQREREREREREKEKEKSRVNVSSPLFGSNEKIPPLLPYWNNGSLSLGKEIMKPPPPSSIQSVNFLILWSSFREMC
jgi:hypothetical protein